MKNLTVSYFLASNSGKGFFSLFDELYDPQDMWSAYIIKGGPGTGKSSIMKKIADQAVEKGFFCELIHCSSDPDSLDGVIIPELKVSICDGTAPHVMEARYPGACEKIVNLGTCWHDNSLKNSRNSIMTLTDCNKALHKRSSRYVTAAAAAISDNKDYIETAVNKEKMDNFVTRNMIRCIKCNNGYGNESKRFLNAITPKGRVVFFDTALKICDTIISITDEYTCISANLIKKLTSFALANGANVVTCLDPLTPSSDPLHLILPNERIGFFTSNSYHNFKPYATKNINASRFVDKNKLNIYKNRLNFNKRVADGFIDEAINVLKKAKTVHDDLEKHYITAMDYDKLGIIADNLINEIFSV